MDKKCAFKVDFYSGKRKKKRDGEIKGKRHRERTQKKTELPNEINVFAL